jgi:pilus assembly protein CpaB
MNRNTRLLIVLIVALGAAGIASFAAWHAVRTMPARVVAVPTVQTVVAARSLPLGTLVGPSDLKLVAWPATSVVPGAFRTTDAVVNRGLVAGVAENEPLTAAKLAPAGTGGGLAPTIPEGMRAISIRVNEVVGVAGFVQPGAHVDVVAVVRGDTSSTVSRSVLTNIKVLAAGTRADQVRANVNAPQTPTTVVTLLVSPSEAERLALASSEGSVTLVLRNPLDTGDVATEGTRLPALTGGRPAPSRSGAPTAPIMPRRPAKAQVPVIPEVPPPYMIETIRAAKRSQETLQ